MNKYIRNSAAALASAALMFGATACNDLDTKPLGSTVTTEQKEATIEANPAMAQAGVNALPTRMKALFGCFPSGGYHNDFGLPSLFMILDQMGLDEYSLNSGYNWYSAASELNGFNNNYLVNYYFWLTFYDNIFTANAVCQSIPADAELASNKFSRAQALCYRAYGYWNLVQMYQFTYDGHENAPSVPLITDENSVEVAMNGCPRATVAQVYEQIMSDLNEAIDLIADAQEAGQRRTDKSSYDLAAAYGLRARVNLTMCKYSEAASDAQSAITQAAAQGIVPASMEAVSVPTFGDSSESNWMLAVEVDPNDEFVSGVVNWNSMMGPWMSNGYCSTGTYRQCNKKLYEFIPDTDVRKGWFCDNDGNVPASLPAAYAAYAASAENAFLPRTVVKFMAYNNNPGGTVGASDVPMMRVEEMYLIKAEAEGMQSPATGKATLENFVTTYRDPAYKCSATTPEEFRDAVWMQRRVELWGEGLSWFDLQRMKKRIDRRGCGFPAAWVFNVAPEDPCRIFIIVESETNANPQISAADCNTGATQPTPIPDVEE